MARRRRKNRKTVPYVDPQLNIMPFIDIFSMLNVFLLFSAVFLSIGIIEVQVPFLSNAPAPPEESTRQFEIHVNVDRVEVELQTRFTMPPLNESVERFTIDAEGLTDFHARLVTFRSQYAETDKVTVFSDDDVTFEQLTQVLDAIKYRRDGDPQFTERDPSGEERVSSLVYPKVVMGSVML